MGLLNLLGKPVKEIVAMGYPESVAKRISSGDLPMDEASRAARRDAFGEKMYRGLGQAYEEGKGTNASTWATPDPSFASGYAIENAERLIDPAANVIPVRVRAKNPLDLGFRTSFTEVKPDNIANRVGTRIHEDFSAGKISREEAIRADDAIWDWYEGLHDLDKQAFRPVFSYWNKDKGFIDAIKKAGYDSIQDAEVSSGSWGSLSDTPDVKTLGVLDDANIRSDYAAFDPEYTGSNILGSPSLLGALAGSMSLEEMQQQQAEQELDNLMGQYNEFIDRKPDIYNYGDLAPVKRNVVSGDYSLTVPTMVDDIVKGLLDIGQSRKTGVVNSGTSLLDVLL
jgi:hypothetical protein